MNVLIHRDQAQEKITEGGLYVPESVQERPQTATVIATGPGEYGQGAFIPMPVTPGQRVLIGKYSGVDIDVDGRTLSLIQATDILGVLEDEQSTEGE
jgi:chaperonin GroES